MKYDPNDAQSTNVEDRRDQSGEGLGGGGGMQLPIGGGMGLTTMLIVGAVMLLFGFNPLELLGGGGAGGMPNLPQHPRVGGATGQSGGGYGVPGANSPAQPASHAEDPMKVRVAQVLKDTEDVWTDVFQSMGKRYTPPRLVIFSGATRTGCGTGQTAMGARVPILVHHWLGTLRRTSRTMASTNRTASTLTTEKKTSSSQRSSRRSVSRNDWRKAPDRSITRTPARTTSATTQRFTPQIAI